jgi:CRISPR-associated protein Csb2
LDGHGGNGADVVYCWPTEDPEAAERAANLDRLAAAFHTLGWGVDFAAAEFSLGEAGAAGCDRRLVPSQAGGSRSYQVPVAGTLDSLDVRFRAFRRRITPKGVNPALPPARMAEVFYLGEREVPSRQWAVYSMHPMEHPQRFHAVPAESAIHVAAWVRHAAAEALREEEFDEDWIARYVQGHTEPDAKGYRLSYVPLPSIGARHVDGRIRRILVGEPWGEVDPADREAFEILKIRLNGCPLVRPGDAEPVAQLRRIDGPADPATRLYGGSFREWSTVTPVVLHGFNVQRSSISVAKTTKLLVQAFGAAGIPASAIGDIAFQTAPYRLHLPAAAGFQAPAHLAKWPRLHVRVTFLEPVSGPLVIGLGRHAGLGLFAPEG